MGQGVAMVTRRTVLGLIGGGAVAALVGCGSDDDPTSASTTSTTGSTGGAADCGATIPEETAGPFPGDGSNGPDVLGMDGVVRQDITQSIGGGATAEGVPMTIQLDLLDSAVCAPLAGAAVYVWHCDREGRYSMYSDGVTDETYLRGVQEADAAGRVMFTSVFPGAYPGRWPHVHFEVYESLGGSLIATSQVALPEDACNAAYTTAGYEASVPNMQRTTLSNDNVFSDDEGVMQLGTAIGDASTGYTVQLSVPVNAG
jgi:protocatechuate 3,4-dioxygenase beta subunit